MRAALAIAAAVLAAAGCGGESADQKLGRWQSRADAACREAMSRIAERGRPTSVRDLDRVTLRAVADVRAAMQEILRHPVPEGSEPRVRPFVDTLERVEPRLEELVASGEFADPVRMLVAVDKVQRPADALEREAKRAGLRDCAPQGFATRVTDALLTPLFVEGLERTRRKLVATIRSVNRLPVTSRAEQEEYFRELSFELSLVQDDFAGLYPPATAAVALNDFAELLTDASDTAWGFALAVHRGYAVRRERVAGEFRRLARRQAAAYERIFEAIDAPPDQENGARAAAG